MSHTPLELLGLSEECLNLLLDDWIETIEQVINNTPSYFFPPEELIDKLKERGINIQ